MTPPVLFRGRLGITARKTPAHKRRSKKYWFSLSLYPKSYCFIHYRKPNVFSYKLISICQIMPKQASMLRLTFNRHLFSCKLCKSHTRKGPWEYPADTHQAKRGERISVTKRGAEADLAGGNQDCGSSFGPSKHVIEGKATRLLGHQGPFCCRDRHRKPGGVGDKDTCRRR